WPISSCSPNLKVRPPLPGTLSVNPPMSGLTSTAPSPGVPLLPHSRRNLPLSATSICPNPGFHAWSGTRDVSSHVPRDRPRHHGRHGRGLRRQGHQEIGRAHVRTPVTL